MNRLVFLLIGIIGIFIFFPALAPAEEFESMGRFRFLDLFLSPRLHYQQSGPGGFELDESWIGFQWQRDERVKAIIKLGSSDLIRPLVWYAPTQDPRFQVVEAWMEGRSSVGDLRAGLLAVPQGFEGAFPEWNSVLPESAVRRRGWILQRDYGLQFRWDTQPWATALSVHNGESGADKDRELWFSGLWQYKDSDGWGLLLTASTGHTSNDSTQGSVAASREGFVFDSSADAKIRYAILSLFKEEGRSLFLLEAGRGDLIQQERTHPFLWGRADVVWNFGGDASLLLRYEQTSSDMTDSGTRISTPGLGVVLASADNLQSLTLYASRNDEPNRDPNYEFWLIFRLHSNLLK
ncbi:MAG: hypothetical protein C5B49_06380 [Bdellovibrio sp.]|nr:MAG: hypothetical protein C5B49_06380 [Bdellovibrio sp.]